MARVHEELGRRVVELIGPQAAHDGDVVGHVGQVREQLGEDLPRLAVLLEPVG